MTRHAQLMIGALAALYLLWLATWIVFGGAVYGASQHYWDQAAVTGVTGLAAWWAAPRRSGPYRGFLAMQGIAFLLLTAAWVTYHSSVEPSTAAATPSPDSGADQRLTISSVFYASFVFSMLSAWSYLAFERWRDRPLSPVTTIVFSGPDRRSGGDLRELLLHPVRRSTRHCGRPAQRRDGRARVHGARGELVLHAASGTVPVVWMLVGTVILIAGDMAFSVDAVPKIIEVAWMLGQFLVLSAVVAMAQAQFHETPDPEPSHPAVPGSHVRSGISGILILVSLGAVLVSPLVWLMPVGAVWKSFCSALFIVSLVVVLVWITDRFDDTVKYLRSYVRRMHESRLVSEDWRGAPPRIRSALNSTGLGTFLDEVRDAGARLRQDVLFLGPERLFGPPREHGGAQRTSCFIVMPFGQEWSVDVRRILSSGCEALGVRAVRGDDLFTPTDFLEDIWQSINAADFVIADITGRNPNVLYELGIAHTLAKPVLILSKHGADIPVDLATRRVILYGQSEIDWREDLAHKISEAVAGIVRDYGLTRPSISSSHTKIPADSGSDQA